jgi:hypothetical protein
MWWSGFAFTDYYPIIAGAVSKLPDNTVEARQELYNHARATLARQLEHDTRIERERRALEKAIRQAEIYCVLPGSAGRTKYEPASTILLLASMYFPGCWLLDVTCMSLYWVARLPRMNRARDDLSLLAFRKAHIP